MLSREIIADDPTLQVPFFQPERSSIQSQLESGKLNGKLFNAHAHNQTICSAHCVVLSQVQGVEVCLHYVGVVWCMGACIREDVPPIANVVDFR